MRLVSKVGRQQTTSSALICLFRKLGNMPISMSVFHARGICEIAERFETLPALLADASAQPEPLLDAIRVVEIPDRGMSNRKRWLQDCLPSPQVYRFREGDVRYLAQVEESYGLMIVSGDDRPRLLSIVRNIRSVLPSKIVVAFLSHCSPEERTLFLRRGADDVLHLDMHPKEGAARLAALLRRKSWAANKPEAIGTSKDRVALAVFSLCNGTLPKQNRQVLAALFLRMGRVVSFAMLIGASRTSDHWPSKRQLMVLVCGIRKHLHPDYAIETVRGEGYKLVVRNPPDTCN